MIIFENSSSKIMTAYGGRCKASSARIRGRETKMATKVSSQPLMITVWTVTLLVYLLTVDHHQQHVSCLLHQQRQYHHRRRRHIQGENQSNGASLGMGAISGASAPSPNPDLPSPVLSSQSPPSRSSTITTSSTTACVASSMLSTTSTSLISPVVASPIDQTPPPSLFTSRFRQLSLLLLGNRGREKRRQMIETKHQSLYEGNEEATIATISALSLRGEEDILPTDRQWTKQNLAIALPALMGLLADPVLSMVDTAFVGRVSSIDLAALGVCTSLFHMAFTIFRASTVATTSLVSSAESIEEKRQITKISLGFAGVMGSLVMLALRFGGPSMLTSMGISQESSPAMYKSACSYLFARCWAAPAVVGIVVAEGAFRGNRDNATPLLVATIAALINLVLDPILMFPLGMGMAGAAVATALSQVGGASLYAWRLWKRQLLPQAQDTVKVNVSKVLKQILGANAACLAKNGSMLVFYTLATSFATRMGPAHVATHQVCLSFFWLVTMWLDSGSVSAQLLMADNMERPARAWSLTKYMMKFALAQGLVFSAFVAGVGKFVPGVFTSDSTVMAYISKCLPYLALQQTLVSLCLVLEGLAAGGNQFKFLATGTAAATAAGFWQMTKATSVVDIWASAVNVFFGVRVVNALIGNARAHADIRRKQGLKAIEEQPARLASKSPLTAKSS